MELKHTITRIEVQLLNKKSHYVSLYLNNEYCNSKEIEKNRIFAHQLLINCSERRNFYFALRKEREKQFILQKASVLFYLSKLKKAAIYHSSNGTSFCSLEIAGIRPRHRFVEAAEMNPSIRYFRRQHRHYCPVPRGSGRKCIDFGRDLEKDV